MMQDQNQSPSHRQVMAFGAAPQSIGQQAPVPMNCASPNPAVTGSRLGLKDLNMASAVPQSEFKDLNMASATPQQSMCFSYPQTPGLNDSQMSTGSHLANTSWMCALSPGVPQLYRLEVGSPGTNVPNFISTPPQQQFGQPCAFDPNEAGRAKKPPFSFPCLIGLALRDSTTGRMSVSEIYASITKTFPYFRTAKAGWKNSVRHNLSLNKMFCKLERRVDEVGKGALWGVADGMQDQLDRDINQCEQRYPQKIAEAKKEPEAVPAMAMGMGGGITMMHPLQIQQMQMMQQHAHQAHHTQNAHHVHGDRPNLALLGRSSSAPTMMPTAGHQGTTHMISLPPFPGQLGLGQLQSPPNGLQAGRRLSLPEGLEIDGSMAPLDVNGLTDILNGNAGKVPLFDALPLAHESQTLNELNDAGTGGLSDFVPSMSDIGDVAGFGSFGMQISHNDLAGLDTFMSTEWKNEDMSV